MAADDPTTWFPIGDATATKKKTAPGPDADDPATWFPVGGTTEQTAPPPAPTMPSVDEYGRVIPGAFPAPDPNSVASRIGGAVVEGWRDVPPILTPAAQTAVEEGGPVGRYLVSPALKIVGGAVAGGNALLQGGRQALHEATQAGGVPGLDRDINMLMDILPFTHTPTIPAGRPSMRPGEPSPKFVSERTAPPREPGATDADRILQLIRHDEAERRGEPPPSAAEPPSGGPSPGMGGPGGAVGADITIEPIPPETRAQRITNLTKTVQQTAEDRAGPQQVDNSAYVEGIPPRLLAGRDFSKNVNALDEKVAREKDPVFKDAVDANKKSRNTGMLDLLRKDAGDGNSLEALHDARDLVSPAALGVFEKEQPVDASKLAAKIQRKLDGPEGKEGAVRTTLKNVLDSLYDKDGNLETLPSRLYGARKNLTTLLKKGVKGTGDLADDVRASKHHLEDLLGDFDPLITGGAPGFTDYLAAWREASKPINQQEFLQKYQTGPGKLTDGDGYLQFGKVQKMLDDILQAHQGRGVHKAQTLTDEQIGNIEAVRNELAADKLQDRKAATRGSDSFQKFNAGWMGEGPIANALKMGMQGIATVGTGGAYHFVGKPLLDANKDRRVRLKTEQRKRELLAPPDNQLLDY